MTSNLRIKFLAVVIVIVLLGMSYSRLNGYFGFGIILLISTVLFYQSPVNGIGLLALINPFTLLLRNAAPSSVVLAGTSDILLISFAFIGLLSRKTNQKLKKNNAVIFMLLLFLMLSVANSLRTGDISTILLNIRTYIIPFFIVFIVYYFVNNINDVKNICVYMVIGILIVACIYSAKYLGLVDIQLLGEDSPGSLAIRDVGGLEIMRGSSLIGGGPSAMGVLFTSMLPLCVWLAWEAKTIIVAGWWYICFCMFLFCTVTLASNSSVIFVIFFLITMFYLYRLNILWSILLLTIVAVILFIYIGGYFILSTSIMEYISNASPLWFNHIPDNIFDLLIGKGNIPTHAGGLIRTFSTLEDSFVDVGLIGLIYMQGLVGVIPWIFILGKLINTPIHFHKYPRFRISYYTLTAVTISLLFASIHQLVFYRQRLNITFLITLGLCCVFSELSLKMMGKMQRVGNPRKATRVIPSANKNTFSYSKLLTLDEKEV